MGSGNRIAVTLSDAFGFGVYVARFPFAVTFGLHFLLWQFTVGFGKGYDK